MRLACLGYMISIEDEEGTCIKNVGGFIETPEDCNHFQEKEHKHSAVCNDVP